MSCNCSGGGCCGGNDNKRTKHESKRKAKLQNRTQQQNKEPIPGWDLPCRTDLPCRADCFAQAGGNPWGAKKPKCVLEPSKVARRG